MPIHYVVSRMGLKSPMNRCGRVTTMVATLVTACAGDNGELRTVEQPISAIIEDRVEPVIRFYHRGTEGEALRSHAVGYFSTGCTATWIGPLTAVTAAHCGGRADGSGVFVRMEWYPGVDTLGDAALENTNSKRKDYRCTRKLATAFRASGADLAVWECGQGQEPAPGDRFGWVEYSILDNHDTGDSVYSVWFNPVETNPEWGSIRLLSAGRITTTTQTSWAAPNCVTGSASRLPFIHHTNVLTEGGASGSLQLSPATQTSVIGPTSTGNANGRNASAWAQILNQAFLPPGERYRVETEINPDLPPATPGSNGCGLPGELQNPRETDTGGNLLLDVQEGVDNHVTTRPIYNFDFDSRWRRLLWETGPAFSSVQRLGSTSSHDMVLHGTSGTPDPSGFLPALRHRRASFARNTRHDIRLLTQAASQMAVKVRFKHQDEEHCPTDEASGLIPGSNVRAWTTYSIQTGDCSGYMLDILVEPSRIVLLGAVLVSERNAVWSFENWDEREPWTSTGSDFALIYENGSPARADEIFAAQITGGADADNIRHRTLVLPAIPILPGERYALTFRARNAWPELAIGLVEVGSTDGTPALFEQFSPGRSWSDFRFDFDAGTIDGQILEFSLMGRGRISIDDVRLVLCENRVCP